MKRCGSKGKRLGTRGESMVVAVVLMLVFFILGLAVLTGASVASSSVNSRLRYRQAYYYARSVLNLLDESLQTGELGKYVCEHELRLLTESGEGQVSGTRTLNIPLDFDTAMQLPEGISFVDGQAKLTYEARAQYLIQNAAARVTLTDAVLSFRVEYAGRSYGVRVVYSYSGVAESSGGAWEWTGGWRLRSMS